MKNLPTFFLLGSIALAGAVTASAQDPEFNPLGREVPVSEMEKQIRIQIEWIEVAHEDLTALLEPDDPTKPNYRNSSNAGPLRGTLKEMIADGEAKIIETAIVVARSGQRAKVESIHEMIYPTEYDPPELPTEVDGEIDKGAVLTTVPTATAFETRNCGTTLEVDPVIGVDDVTIDLNLAPEIVYPVGESIYGEYQSGESEVDLKMPIFYTVRISTQVTTIAGEYSFIGVQTPVNADSGLPDFDRKVMIFLKTDMILTGLPPRQEEDGKKAEAEPAKQKDQGKDKDKDQKKK